MCEAEAGCAGSRAILACMLCFGNRESLWGHYAGIPAPPCLLSSSMKDSSTCCAASAG